MKAIGLFLIAAVCLSSICPLVIGYPAGTGTPDDPYWIAEAADLIELGNTPADWDKAFVVTADIDLTGYSFDKAIIAPDTDNATGGFQGTQFTGVLDGNSLKISNLIITASTQNYVGLFGSVGSGGQIGNVGVENVNITGLYGVGGMVGENYGALTFCYATGAVTGTDYVGGLVGFNYGSLTSCHTTGSVGGDHNVGGLMAYNEYGSLTFCYATGAVTGINQVGGLVGYDHFGTLTSCYATGSVTGSESVGGLMGYTYQGTATSCYATGLVTGNWYVGGLMGYNDGGTINASFWDTQTSGQETSYGGEGKTTAEMMTQSTFTAAGWDFDPAAIDGNPAVWKMTSEGFAYPTLAWQPDVNTYSGGTGTPNDPYQIATVGNLLHMSATPADWDKHFIVTADIDLTGLTFTQAPIAPDTDNFNLEFQGTQFTGVFDGNDHTISNLTIAASTKDFVGLFGYVGYVGQIFNLGIENVTMTGDEYVGGLVGRNEGSLTFCSATGSVTIEGSAVRYVGGLVGYNNSGTLTSCSASGSVSRVSDYSYAVGGLVGGNDGTLTSCYATGSVTAGGYYAGGLVGRNYRGTLTSCYATGAVIGYDYVGGLVGYNYGTLTSCYAIGSVTCYFYVGGLVGYNDGGTINASFWDTQTSGQETSYGGEGKTTAEMMTQSTFTAAGWDFDPAAIDGNPAVWKMTSEGSAYPTLAWQPDVNTYSGGDGTPQDPYQIATVDHLLLMSGTPIDWDKAFILTADIDLTGYIFDKAVIAPDTDSSDYEFQGTRFTGTFEGSGHTLSNLTISNTTGGDYLGLFGYADGATIQNLSLSGVLVDVLGGDSSYIGGLIGYQTQGLTENCSSSGTIHAGAYDPLFGGDIGNYAGGLIGEYWAEDTDHLAMNRCSSSVEVHGTSFVGGLVGAQWNCTLRECFTTGSVEGWQFIGGLVGDAAGFIERCFSTAAVRNLWGGTYLGGMVGNLAGGTISDSYARGSVFADSASSFVGGFMGSGASLIRCYSANTITLNDYVSGYVGAFVGYPQGSVNACFFDITIVGWTDNSSAATGLSTAEMQTSAAFINAGWDFEPESVDGTPAVWRVRDGYGYPQLVWQPLNLIPGDIAGSPAVDMADLMAVAEDWMQACSGCPSDANNDGYVNLLDFVILGSNWMDQP
jgi:hypothetical protein